LALTAILLTHHHHDHVGGVAKLLVSQSADGEIPVIGPAARLSEHLTRRVKQGDHVSIASSGAGMFGYRRTRSYRGHIAYFQPGDPQGGPPASILRRQPGSPAAAAVFSKARRNKC